MVSVKNEWGKLREVFVGTIDNANMPKHGVDLHAINYADGSNPILSAITFYDEGTRLGTGSECTMHIECYFIVR